MLLVIDNYDSFTYNLVQYLGELGVEVIVKRNDAIDVAGIRAERPAAFFDGWTRKEAYIKAIGEGLAYPLERFSVSLSPHAPAKLEDVRDDPAEVERWSLAALAAAFGYAAALAIEGPLPRLLCARWQERAC